MDLVTIGPVDFLISALVIGVPLAIVWAVAELVAKKCR